MNRQQLENARQERLEQGRYEREALLRKPRPQELGAAMEEIQELRRTLVEIVAISQDTMMSVGARFFLMATLAKHGRHVVLVDGKEEFVYHPLIQDTTGQRDV